MSEILFKWHDKKPEGVKCNAELQGTPEHSDILYAHLLPAPMETCDKCGKDWVKSPVQMRGLLSPTTRHPSLGDDRLKHFCDRVCLMRYLLTPEEMKTLRGDKSK